MSCPAILLARTLFLVMTAGIPGCSLFTAADAREPGPSVVWTRQDPAMRDAGLSWDGTPAVVGDLVLIETPTGVRALRPATGETAWEARLWAPRAPVANTIEHGGGRLFVAERDSLYALDGATGTRLWAAVVGDSGAYGGDVLALGEDVLVTTRTPSVALLDAATGRTRWEATPASWAARGVIAGLAVRGDTVYAAGAEFFTWNGAQKRAALLALDRATGRTLWSWYADDRHSSAGRGDLGVAGSLVVMADLYGNGIFAVDRFGGTLSWRVAGAPNSFGPSWAPVIVGDTAFVASNDRYVYAIDARDGRVLWKRMVEGSIDTFALCGDFLLANQLEVVAVDRRAGHRVDHVLGDDGPIGIPTSGFGVLDGVAVVTGVRGVAGIACR